MHLKGADFAAVFQDKLSRNLKQKIKEYDFRYELLKPEEKEQWRKLIRKKLRGKLVSAGLSRQKHWEEGWGQNLKEKNVIPHYFGKYPVIRWRQDLIKPLSKNFEYYTLAVITQWLLEKYLQSAKTVYEFGCGTGHNLLRLRQVNPQAEIWGLDWAGSSQRLVKNLGFTAAKLDMFKPVFKLKPKASVFTVAALEQLGKKFRPIVKFWIKNKVDLVINIEPINELLNPHHQLDRLAIRYAQKRNYLDGYLTYLQNLEKEGKIKIHEARRTFIGSLLIDGYSAVVWSPKL